MEDLAKDLIDTFMVIARTAQALRNFRRQIQSELDEQERRDELRKGSIDVEYRVIK